jgi:hypothetical protein
MAIVEFATQIFMSTVLIAIIMALIIANLTGGTLAHVRIAGERLTMDIACAILDTMATSVYMHIHPCHTLRLLYRQKVNRFHFLVISHPLPFYYLHLSLSHAFQSSQVRAHPVCRVNSRHFIRHLSLYLTHILIQKFLQKLLLTQLFS